MDEQPAGDAWLWPSEGRDPHAGPLSEAELQSMKAFLVACELNQPVRIEQASSSSAGEQQDGSLPGASSSSAGDPGLDPARAVQPRRVPPRFLDPARAVQPRRVPPRFAPATPGLVAGRRSMEVLPKPVPAGLIVKAPGPIEVAAVADESGSMSRPSDGFVFMGPTPKWGLPSGVAQPLDPRAPQQLPRDEQFELGEQVLARGRDVIAVAFDLLGR